MNSPIAKSAVASAMAPPRALAGPISYRRLLRWSVQVVAGAPWLFAASLATGVLASVLSLYSVRLVARIISALGAANADTDAVVTLAVAYAALTAVALAVQYASRVLTIRSNGAMLARLQMRLHDRVLAMPPEFHAAHGVAETTQIVLQDAAGCQPLLRDLVAFPVTQGIALVAALVFLAQSLGDLRAVPPGMQAVLAAILLLLPPVGFWLAARVRHAFADMRAGQVAVGREFANSATTPLEVRLLGAEAQRSAAFGRSVVALTRHRIRALGQSELANQFQAAMPTVLQAGFLTYAAVVARAGGAAAAGAILAVYYFVPKVIEPLDQIIRFFGGLQMIWVQAARLGEVLDAVPAPEPAGHATIAAAPSIALRDLSFRYPGAERRTLSGLSHVFPAGRISAIVGRSGSGKSSLLGLLAGLRGPDAGAVLIDGHPLAELGAAELRRSIAVVSQFPMFVEGTVRENFQLARADATDAEIAAAAEAVGLWPALTEIDRERPLDLGIPRMAGQGGLSGGQRKLLAIARTLLRAPKILLLDEPTTGIDTLSLETLRAALRAACAGRTAILVEHNLDLVDSLADQVCCLQDGGFVDVGTPAELAGRPSLFRTMREARGRLVDMAGMEVRGVAPPRLAGGTMADPFAKNDHTRE
jgi:subfamily B ATP-binding cassette protein MsbA